MSDYTWLVELTVRNGQQDAFGILVNDMLTAIQANEPGTLNYDMFVNEELSICHIYEKYVDGEAFKKHLELFNAGFAERFGSVVEVTKFTVYGDPNAEIRELLAGFDAVIMEPFGSIVR